MSRNFEIVEKEDDNGIVHISITCDKEMLISIRDNLEETEGKVVLQIPRLSSIKNKIIGSICVIEENKKTNPKIRPKKQKSSLIHDGYQVSFKQTGKIQKHNIIHIGEQYHLIIDEEQNNI